MRPSLQPIVFKQAIDGYPRRSPMQLIYEGGGWDPNGGLYRGDDNRLYRIIAPHMRDFYLRALDNRELQALVADGKLIESTIVSDLGEPGTLTLRHEVVRVPTYPFEWSREMFAAAARLMIEVCERLIPHGMCLQDASFWNVLFVGRKSVFVDFTSIVPLTDEGFDEFVGEFHTAVLSSLELIRDGHVTLLRRISRDYGRAITADVALHLLPRIRPRRSSVLAAIDEILAKPSLTMGRRLMRRYSTAAKRHGWKARASYEVRLRELSEAVNRHGSQSTQTTWGSYYDGANGLPIYDGTLRSLSAVLASDKKHGSMAELIERIKPARYLDLGCNRGLYAHFASQCGATAVGIDIDEQALDQMFADGEGLGSTALPCFADVVAPASPVGPPGKRWPSLAERCRSDMVSCLALVHHLMLGLPRIADTVIADLLSDYASDWLVVEFVHPEDPFLRQAYGTPPTSYSAERFLTALDAHFTGIERRPSSIPTRELFVCRKRVRS